MKSDYRVRARKFLKSFWKYLVTVDLHDMYQVEYALQRYVCDHPSRRVDLCSGSARMALVTADYVIKWDYDEENIEEIGGCDSEQWVYENAKRAGFAHLFAEVTPYYFEGYEFVIMPRIPNIGRVAHERLHCMDISEMLTEAEEDYINSIHLTDLHSYNWGIKNHKPVIIDYAYIEDYDNATASD